MPAKEQPCIRPNPNEPELGRTSYTDSLPSTRLVAFENLQRLAI